MSKIIVLIGVLLAVVTNGVQYGGGGGGGGFPPQQPQYAPQQHGQQQQDTYGQQQQQHQQQGSGRSQQSNYQQQYGMQPPPPQPHYQGNQPPPNYGGGNALTPYGRGIFGKVCVYVNFMFASWQGFSDDFLEPSLCQFYAANKFCNDLTTQRKLTRTFFSFFSCNVIARMVLFYTGPPPQQGQEQGGGIFAKYDSWYAIFSMWKFLVFFMTAMDNYNYKFTFTLAINYHILHLIHLNSIAM